MNLQEHKAGHPLHFLYPVAGVCCCLQIIIRPFVFLMISDTLLLTPPETGCSGVGMLLNVIAFAEKRKKNKVDLRFYQQ